VTAGGIILLYRIWDVPPVQLDRTLNAVAFERVIASFTTDAGLAKGLLIVTLVFEGALLFVAANTGFLGGPAVLANLATDRWAPNKFSSLSSRLVAGNGVLLRGAAAALYLIGTRGDVTLRVALYSVAVRAVVERVRDHRRHSRRHAGRAVLERRPRCVGDHGGGRVLRSPGAPAL
jgi:hypothetical protein